jgi:tetratricopeptide (TPR) repeat protein
LRPIIDREEISSKRYFQFFLDALFFRGKSKLFDEYYKKYQENWKKDDTNRLYDIYSKELSGNLVDAEKGYIELCERLESPLIYQQLIKFYIRCNRPEKIEEIYDTLATKKRNITDPDASNFYCVYIIFLINQRNYKKAVDIYCAYEELITEATIKVELENLIKPLICDYSNHEQRISEYEKIYEEFSVPHALYDIGMLYLNNNQFEKAKEYFDKAESVGFPIDQHIRNASEILLGKQVDSTLLMPSRVCEIFALNQIQIFRQDGRVLEKERLRLSEEILLDAQSIYIIFFLDRLDCLDKYKRIYITYAAQYDIHISLFCQESQLIRRIITWMGNDSRIHLVAPKIKWYQDLKNKYPQVNRDYISGICMSNELGIPLITPYASAQGIVKEAWYESIGIDALCCLA